MSLAGRAAETLDGGAVWGMGLGAPALLLGANVGPVLSSKVCFKSFSGLAFTPRSSSFCLEESCLLS